MRLNKEEMREYQRARRAKLREGGVRVKEAAVGKILEAPDVVVLEMLGRLEKRVAALEADLVDRMVRLEDNVRDVLARKEPTRAIGSYHNKKDSPEELFKRVVAEKAERLSIP